MVHRGPGLGVPGRPHPLSPQLCDPPTCHSRLFAAAGEPTHDKEGTALEGKALPVYGDGQNIRDWLYVRDHCEAIRQVLAKGRLGETYNVGGKNEIRNLDVVQVICAKLDALRPKADGTSYASQITFVADRPGHDRRYAIDPTKIEAEIGWTPAESFETGIDKTVKWYLENTAWIDSVRTGAYREWVSKNYSTRD